MSLSFVARVEVSVIRRKERILRLQNNASPTERRAVCVCVRERENEREESAAEGGKDGEDGRDGGMQAMLWVIKHGPGAKRHRCCCFT
eukprot:scaffold926_cov248-Pinguiococcus_pyrenoidosus.AAC.5